MYKFLLNLLFPASTAQNLAIFLFLIILLATSQLEVVQQYFFEGGLTRDISLEASKMAFGGQAGRIGELAAMVKIFSLLSLVLFLIAGFSLLIVLVLLGKIKPDHESPFGHQYQGYKNMPNSSLAPGFSLALYALGMLGAGLTSKGASVTFIYFSALVFFGFPFLTFYIKHLNVKETAAPSPLVTVRDSLFGVLTSGAFFFYYWLSLNQIPLTALISAYASYTICMTIYRLVIDTFKRTTVT